MAGPPEAPTPGRLLVVGAGLIGTSLALAARAAGYEVWIDDTDADRLSLAVSVGAGQPRSAALTAVEVAVAAVPPGSVGAVVHDLLACGIAPVVTHLASVQADPQRQVESLNPAEYRFVGSHPVAGRERSGPHHASADLFAQRPWIVCPTPSSGANAQAAVVGLAEACGAVVTVMSAEHHDALLARLSHVPQLLASALAGSLVGLDRSEVALAGTGLRDTSRLADSPAALWAEIVAANPAAVAQALRAVMEPLEVLASTLERSGPDDAARMAAAGAVDALLNQGHRGRDLLAGKHGQIAVRWGTVSVIVPDEPGALARLLVEASEAQINVEDIRVDHSPGQPLGVVELDVAPESATDLERSLADRGWAATASPPALD